ncbi:hypothetical protein CBR_g17064 [Chara braunii]|uniref:Uncharacterized protein n=1 Tax=Chara braunii TaxID=69332 RepID=A0A388KUI0_CHABU|nr:hypothetical protein CBR_g17064 [Chara braunii]|eukprot:GBG73724.1 hypothetical protein CBR_g17064 [Chara braunii]
MERVDWNNDKDEDHCGCSPCMADRLYIFRNQLLENVDLELTFESTCAFLTLDSLRPYGGNYTVYSTGIDGQQEEYFVSEDMQAPTLGYEKYVGNKTTFESLNAKFAHMLRHDDSDWEWRDPPAIFVMFEPFRLKETYVHIRTQFPTIESLLFSPEFFAKAHQIYDRLQDNLERFEFGCFTGEKPMSGFYAVLYALSACDQVDLYGFEPWTDAMARGMRHARYHYFNGEEPRPGAHSFDATYMMYELMKTVPDLRLMVNEIPIPTDDEELLARDLVVNDNGLTATAVQDGADLEGEDGVVEHNRDRNGIRERGSRGHSRRSTDWAVRGEMKRSQENTERDEGVEFW